MNLGDVLNAERLIFVGEGGFGSVFALPEQRLAIKVFKRPAPIEQVIRDVANESACFHLASTYPIQKVSEIYNKVTEMYNKVSELEILSWNVLSLLRSEVAYIGTGPILP